MKRVAVAPQQNTHQTHSHPLRFACSSFNTEHSVPHDTNSNPSLSMASSSSFSSLCSFPPLTPASTFTKPPKLPYLTAPPTLSPQLPKRCRFATSVTKDREVAVVKDNQLEEKRSRFDDADPDRLLSRAINTALVLGFGTFAVSKLLTIDHDYWHGWTLYEILRYVPEHNWVAYEQALKSNPVLAKMAISGVVYSIGDWIAQCYEGKPLFEFDRTRLFRSGLAGFTLHGSLSHYYYQLCESLFPFQEWWVVPAKVAFDQTVWAAIWNSIYFVVLGLLRFESINNIYGELKSTFWPMLTAGWKLWPFAHLITYGVIPLEQRLLWVDCVELIWVTILSTYSNEKSAARTSDGASSETKSSTLSHKSNKE